MAKGGTLTKSQLKHFKEWMEDGNVSKNNDGTYSTQDAQFRNKLKDFNELKKYFKREFAVDEYEHGGSMGSNNKNGKYLDSISSDKKSKILKNIANHYGISVSEAEEEVRDEDAEMLYEYIANDQSLRMDVYNDMEKGKMAKGGELGDNILVGQVYLNTTSNNYIIIDKVEDSKEESPSVYYHIYNQPKSYRNSNIDRISLFQHLINSGAFVLQPNKMAKGGDLNKQVFKYTDKNLEGRYATRFIRSAGENGLGKYVERLSDTEVKITVPSDKKESEELLEIVEFSIGRNNLIPFHAKGGGVDTMLQVGDKVVIYPNYASHYTNSKGEIFRIMPDGKTYEVKIKHGVGNEYVKFDKSELKFVGGKQNFVSNKYAHGGSIENENREMVLNDNNQIIHHTKELPSAIKGKRVPAWVVANVHESASNLSNATHYMDGQKMAKGGFVGKGEMVWRKLNSNERMDFLYQNFTPQITPRSQEILIGKAYNFLPKNVKIVLESKYENIENYAHGGSMDSQQGIDLFEDYENIPANVQSILDNNEDAFMDGDYKELQKALTQLKRIGYTFEYDLDGQAYDLRPIGTKGKSEMDTFKDGGGMEGKKSVKSYFESINLDKLPAQAKDYINNQILNDSDIDLIDLSDEDFIAIKELISESYSQAIDGDMSDNITTNGDNEDSLEDAIESLQTLLEFADEKERKSIEEAIEALELLV